MTPIDRRLALPILLGAAALGASTLAGGSGGPTSTASAPASLPPADPATEEARFSLTAPSGRSVTLNVRMERHQEVLELSASGGLAKSLEGVTPAALTAELERAEGEFPVSTYQLSVGEVFADSSRELIETSRPSADGPQTQIIKRVQPEGQVLDIRIDTEDTEFQSSWDNMTQEQLRWGGWYGPRPETLAYGLPLKEGSQHTSTASIRSQLFLEDFDDPVLAVLRPLAQEVGTHYLYLYEGLRYSEPLITNQTVTLEGLDPAGQPTFTVSAVTEPWKQHVDLSQGNQPWTLTYELLDRTEHTRLRFSSDGLLMERRHTTAATLKTTLELPSGGLTITSRASSTLTEEVEPSP